MAYQVFPSADFSRFSHSLGVCHVTGQLLDALEANSGTAVSDADWQTHRVAGLLHDVGHYPMSHALEGPIEKFYSTTGADTAFDNGTEIQEPTWLKHEAVGELVVRNSPNIGSILMKHDIDMEKVIEIFAGKLNRENSIIGRRSPLTSLVTSDLDADRIDYLQRTAIHTGLPYGSVDFDYLLSQIVLDGDQRVCLKEQALKTADHFLLARYFDAQQVAFNKTVAGLELILKDVVFSLLNSGAVKLDKPQLKQWIEDGGWGRIDDSWLNRLLENAIAVQQTDSHVKLKARAILERRPPKQIWNWEEISAATPGDSDESVQNFKKREKQASEYADRLAEQFGIDPNLLCVWSQKPFRLTKVSKRKTQNLFHEVDQGGAQTIEEREKSLSSVDQLIRIKRKGEEKANYISELGSSLMSVLDGYALAAVRLYLVRDPESGLDIDAVIEYMSEA